MTEGRDRPDERQTKAIATGRSHCSVHLYFGDKVGLEVAQPVLVDAAFVVPADFGIDAANGQVHPAQAPLCVPVHVLARIDIAGPSITEIEDARQQEILT